ncbi:hypothetical protein GJAV_G00258250 [Gymnothorax javanicus]|nr:hypothetical protein GJAV_G00258250 [Gymnothorax javanicus]
MKVVGGFLRSAGLGGFVKDQAEGDAVGMLTPSWFHPRWLQPPPDETCGETESEGLSFTLHSKCQRRVSFVAMSGQKKEAFREMRKFACTCFSCHDLAREQHTSATLTCE